jgi:hypothetical protein
MSIKKQLRKLAFTKDKVQRAAKFDKINVSYKLRQPSLKTYLKNAVVNQLIKIVKGETSSITQTDLDMSAAMVEQNIMLVAKRNGQNSNLISFQIIEDGDVSVEVIDQHIVIKIEEGVTDFDAVVAAIEANAHASRLVSVILTGDGEDLVALSQTKTITGGR